MPNNPQWDGRLVSRHHGSVAISGRNLSGGAAQLIPPPLPVVRARAAQLQASSSLRSEDLFDGAAHVAHAPSEPIELAPESQRGLSSGAFAKGARSGFAGLRADPQPPAAAVSTFDQIYGTLPSSERAELPVEDLSLDVANPFLASSLQPPPPRSRWRILGWVGGSLALVGLGYAAASFYGNPIRAALRPAQAVHAKAVVAERAVQAPAAVAAPVVKVVPVVQTPVLPAPVVVAEPVPAAPVPALVATAPSTSFPEPSAAPLMAAAEPEPAIVPAPEPVIAKVRSSAAAKPRAPKRRAASKSAVTANSRAQRPSAPPAPVVAAPLPAQPTRAEVRASMESMRGALQSCAAGAHGEIMTTLTIAADGRVTHSLIQGAFVGTPQGSCMARALRGAKFPPFSSPSLNVGYPYVF